MDTELIFWMAFFVGGYALVVGLLLRIVLSGGGGRRGPVESPESQ